MLLPIGLFADLLAFLYRRWYSMRAFRLVLLAIEVLLIYLFHEIYLLAGFLQKEGFERTPGSPRNV